MADGAAEGQHPWDDGGPVYEQVSTRVVYESRYLRLREDAIRRPDGSPGTYSYVEKPDFALIIPVENGGFHLVEQYRYPVRERSWEFPQGTFPGLHSRHDPWRLAAEELRQETGITAAALRHLGHLHCAKGLTSQGFDVFEATGLTHGTPELEVEEQDLRQRWFTRQEVEQMMRSGAITDNATLAAYALLLLKPGS